MAKSFEEVAEMFVYGTIAVVDSKLNQAVKQQNQVAERMEKLFFGGRK